MVTSTIIREHAGATHAREYRQLIDDVILDV